MPSTTALIIEKLKSVYDKKSNQNIVDLKIVDGLHVDETGHVKLSLKVPLGEEAAFAVLQQHIEKIVTGISGVSRITVLSTREKATPPSTTIQMRSVKNIILIGSGKGGVGKSTVATNMSSAMALQGHKVGLLDADIYGPSIPLMLNSKTKPETNESGKILPLLRHGVKHLSIGHMLPNNDAVIWRGPMIQKALLQLLVDTEWGTLDYLFIDLPPGTGDIQLTLAKKIQLTGAVLVTTPQDIALLDVKKAAEMFVKMGTPILGLVENMSSFICPHCDKETAIFDHNGGLAAAQEMQIPVLGRIPLDMAVRVGGDTGQPIATQRHPISETYLKITGDLHVKLAQKNIE